ncbi:hypothetical protein CCM_09310 [Cordyceps militaris CM01]|uniref:Secreted protein n=1 Tax=Cordyceps militaris (strain CM01) TaxID=983644 RepID=G3JU20_CORMM|nr:uncharacterized protein CCM_09310 [Cordyceps militaris CM01]EGX88174.1 hypothetical protein CCM_09310 [Cordyceps militaris CM01]
MDPWGCLLLVACCLTSRLQSWSKKYTSSVGEGDTGKGNKTRLLQVPLLEQDKEEESIASQSAPFRGLLSLICLIAIISRAASSSRSSRNDQHQAGSWDGAVDKVEKHAFGCSVDADTRRCLGSSTSLFAPERSEVRLSTNRALAGTKRSRRGSSSGSFVWVVWVAWFAKETTVVFPLRQTNPKTESNPKIFSNSTRMTPCWANSSKGASCVTSSTTHSHPSAPPTRKCFNASPSTPVSFFVIHAGAMPKINVAAGKRDASSAAPSVRSVRGRKCPSQVFALRVGRSGASSRLPIIRASSTPSNLALLGNTVKGRPAYICIVGVTASLYNGSRNRISWASCQTVLETLVGRDIFCAPMQQCCHCRQVVSADPAGRGPELGPGTSCVGRGVVRTNFESLVWLKQSVNRLARQAAEPWADYLSCR